MANSEHVSFHVGIGTYDSLVFPTASKLDSPPDDARAMANLAATLGYSAPDPKKPNVLIDSAATYEAVVGLFRDAASALKDVGGSCLISFSGHGTEFAGEDEAVCLFDFTLRDDVVAGLIAEFSADTLILLVKDCCHAGGGLGSVLLATERFRVGNAKVNGKPAFQASELAQKLEAQFSGFDRTKIKAKVAVFQACRREQLTFDGVPGKLGVFTGKFVEAVKSGATTVGEVVQQIPKLEPQIPGCDPQFQAFPDDSVLTEPVDWNQPALSSFSV